MASRPHQNGTHPVMEETLTLTLPFYAFFGHALSETCTVFLALCVVAVIARFWSRTLLPTRRFWWDDWTALVTLAFFVAQYSNLFAGISVTFITPEKTKTLTAESFRRGLQRLYIQNLLRPFVLALPKISALLFYLRAFRKQQSSLWKAAWWVTMFCSVAWLVSSLLVSILSCQPIEKIWTPRLPGVCVNRVAAWYWGGTLSDVFVDFLVLFLPLPLLAKMQIKTKRKVLLAGVFFCGSLSVAASIVRLAVLVATTAPSDSSISADSKIHILVMTEEGTALISICLPGVFSLLKRAHQYGIRSLFFPRKQGGTSDVDSNSRRMLDEKMPPRNAGSERRENSSRSSIYSIDRYASQDITPESAAARTANEARLGLPTSDSTSSLQSHRQSISAGRYLNV